MTQALNVIFAGTPQFAVPTLQALLASPHNVVAVFTQPDRPAGRGQKLQLSPVKELALAHKLPVYQPETLKSADIRAELTRLQADVMVVVAYGLIIPEAVLNIPRYGCLNVHGSLLPRWRGAAPIQQAILAGDRETGVTIMQIEKGLDTGPMLLKQACPITLETTSQTMHDQLSMMGAQLLITALTKLTLGELKPEIQDNALATHAAKISKAQANIDWHQSAASIDRMIRAFNPWPIAYTTLAGHALRIWQAQALPETTSAAPGTILAAQPTGIDVATGQGILRILQAQLPGAKVLNCQALLNSKRALFAPGQQCQHD